MVAMLSVAAIAQVTNTPPVPGDNGGSGAINPLSLAALIPFAVPLVIAVIKGIVPKIPKVALPILAPIAGAGLDIALHLATGVSPGTITGALLGAAGVGIREIVDQIKQRLASDTPVPEG